MHFASIFRKFNVVTLVAIVAFTLFFKDAFWRTDAVIRGDAKGYCSYLAAWVIHNDFTFDFYDELQGEEKSRYWLNEYGDGVHFPKLTMGVAIMQLPAYTIAHSLASIFGFEQNGWSKPYHLAIGLNGVLFFIVGLYFIRLLLLKHFSNMVSALAILLIAFATNAYFYGILDGAQSHVYSFSLLAIGLYMFEQWLEKNKSISLYMSALTFGVIALIRPTNAVFMLALLIPLLKQKSWKWLINRKMLLAGLVFLIPLLPQFTLWFLKTGEILFYSYGIERIHWSSPHIIEGLFSYRNGWLLYTPVMILSLAGIWFLRNIDRPLTIALCVIVPLHVYIVFSWWCWYYGSSLSIRPMIDLYPLLAFPLAAFIRWVFSQRLWAGGVLLVLSILLVWNNTLQAHQHLDGQLSGSDMTKQAFKLLLFNSDPPRDLALLGLFSAPDTERLLEGKPERCLRDTTVEGTWDAVLDSDIILNAKNEYGPKMDISAMHFETPFDRTMRFTAKVHSPNFENINAYMVLSFLDQDKALGYHTVPLHKLQLENGAWHSVEAYVRKPKNLTDSGKLEAYLWFQSGNGTLTVETMKLEQLDCPRIE